MLVLLGCSSSPEAQRGPAPHTFAIHAAYDCPTTTTQRDPDRMYYFPPGRFEEVTLQTRNVTYCIDPDPIVSEQNIRAARLVPGDEASVEVTFDDSGAAALRQFTQQWISRPLVILLDGDPTFAGRVQGAMELVWITPADVGIDSSILAEDWQRWANP